MKLPQNQTQLKYINMQAVAPEDIKNIAFSLGKAKAYRDGYMCCCPAHDDANPSLHIWPEENYPLGLKCFTGCKPGDIYNQIKLRGLFPKNSGDTSGSNNSYLKSFNEVHYSEVTKENDNTKYAIELWKKSANATNTPVEAYLKSRGIRNIPPTIRFASSMKHSATKTFWPCMITAITRWPNCHIVGVHRTFLLPDGTDKAPIEPNKMMLGAVSGGAVRLTPINETLIIGEGIETMLSLMGLRSEYAIWAALSASNYQRLILPELPFASTIIIAADNDDAGRKSANLAAQKWLKEGRTVKITSPTKEGTDFNEVLMGDMA